ncbi:MAG TPA: hypothetical protein PLN52_26120 [Opitutaceae bacterium]|nr:hypothetical protein [Opitutaceae bacterium]
MRYAFYIFQVKHPDSFRAGRFLYRFKYAQGERGWWSLYLEKNSVPVKSVILYTDVTMQLVAHRIYHECIPVQIASELHRVCQWLEKRRLLREVRRPKGWR